MCDIDARVLSGMQVTVFDGRVQGGMQLGVLVQVAFWDAVWGAAGCLGGGGGGRFGVLLG